MAEVIPFPLARRRDLIARQARWFGEQKRRSAERNLLVQIEVQAETLRRRGISEDRVADECRTLEAAIRAQISRQFRSPNGAA